jgi:hypothetical protein
MRLLYCRILNESVAFWSALAVEISEIKSFSEWKLFFCLSMVLATRPAVANDAIGSNRVFQLS